MHEYFYFFSKLRNYVYRAGCNTEAKKGGEISSMRTTKPDGSTRIKLTLRFL